jgi:hypothetical protein
MTRAIASMFTKGCAALAALGLGLGVTHDCVAQDATAPAGGTIAYAMYSIHWATYHTRDKKQECPEGFNDGPREQYKALFPNDGRQRTLLETQLRREVDIWFATAAPDKFSFRYATGPTALGMNLDGKIGPNDFTSPDGEKGIDNQLYRVLGCINGFLDGGNNDYFDDLYFPKYQFDRIVILISGVDSLVNSPHVEVTIARGLDPLLTDATGKQFIPGGTQRIDFLAGARFIRHLHGKISDGVLTTEPEDIAYPWSSFGVPTYEFVRAARFRLKLTPRGATGMLGGYTDVETFYVQTIKNHSTHDSSYGQLSQPSLYKALRHVADAYPDQSTGENTAVSSALLTTFVQVFVMPEAQSKLITFEPKHYLTPYKGTAFPRPAAEEAREAGVPISIAKAP